MNYNPLPYYIPEIDSPYIYPTGRWYPTTSNELTFTKTCPAYCEKLEIKPDGTIVIYPLKKRRKK